MLNERVLIFDWETMSQDVEKTPVTCLAAVYFNPYTMCMDLKTKPVQEVYQSLVDQAYFAKFDWKEQIDVYGRVPLADTMRWWKGQSEEARRTLKPDPVNDVTLEEGLRGFHKYCLDSGIKKKSFAFVRGQSFDFPILASLWKSVTNGIYSEEQHPVFFWNQRDTRSFIAGRTNDVTQTKFPVPKVLKEVFVHHDPVHDCVKDAFSLVYAMAFDGDILDVDFSEMEIIG